MKRSFAHDLYVRLRVRQHEYLQLIPSYLVIPPLLYFYKDFTPLQSVNT